MKIIYSFMYFNKAQWTRVQTCDFAQGEWPHSPELHFWGEVIVEPELLIHLRGKETRCINKVCPQRAGHASSENSCGIRGVDPSLGLSPGEMGNGSLILPQCTQKALSFLLAFTQVFSLEILCSFYSVYLPTEIFSPNSLLQIIKQVKPS